MIAIIALTKTMSRKRKYVKKLPDIKIDIALSGEMFIIYTGKG
jgi:hypothetical protein